MKYFVSTLLAALCLFGGCAPADDSAGESFGPADALAVTTENGVTTVRMTGNDQMKYNITAFEVRSGDTVKIIFENIGRMPKASMGHNVIVLQEDVDDSAFATAAAKARENDYIPEDRTGAIIAHTRLLGPGETDTIEFTAPAPGEYDYICSFPGHYFSGMRGVMTVVD